MSCCIQVQWFSGSSRRSTAVPPIAILCTSPAFSCILPSHHAGTTNSYSAAVSHLVPLRFHSRNQTSTVQFSSSAAMHRTEPNCKAAQDVPSFVWLHLPPLVSPFVDHHGLHESVCVLASRECVPCTCGGDLDLWRACGTIIIFSVVSHFPAQQNKPKRYHHGVKPEIRGGARDTLDP